MKEKTNPRRMDRTNHHENDHEFNPQHIQQERKQSAAEVLQQQSGDPDRNLGADAAFFGINDSAASFRMATKSKFGENEYVEWHSVFTFRELAKEVVEKCTKGRLARVYGYLHRSNSGNDGGQYKTEVVATRIRYLERKK